MNLFKKCTLIILLVGSSLVGKSQVSFSHSVGAGYYIGGFAAAPGVLYSPRLNFLELGDELTVSIGTHLGLGLSFNSQSGANSLALDVPVMAEINFGHGANGDTRSNFGGFAGIGFGISKIGSAGAFGNDYNDAKGLVINGGVRAIIKERPVGVRVSYMLNSNTGYNNVLGLGVFYTFGDF